MNGKCAHCLHDLPRHQVGIEILCHHCQAKWWQQVEGWYRANIQRIIAPLPNKNHLLTLAEAGEAASTDAAQICSDFLP
jgi:hypothetical protein